MRAKFRNSLGQTLLEVAMVMPVLLGVSLAALDINHGLRSFTALKEGVRTSLRLCVYSGRASGLCASLCIKARGSLLCCFKGRWNLCTHLTIFLWRAMSII